MKPKFALDLSHEGINLLHRSRGGWSLVGSVDLDDPEMGAHLADLRRRAAALESGGFTCKIIIPNSQVLYTTVEAPGSDDIAREVQIRSGLDGLTPYTVGDLVFDWRAAGERARVAVLARETMDEAETFAVEHRFNPVSFVARPPQGEFSGEPFFGKTRAATKILGPTERVEPDASPVPRKPPAMDSDPTPGQEPVPAAGLTPQPTPQAGPHSPGELTWQPLAEPTPAATPSPAPSPVIATPPAPGPAPLDVRRPAPDPADDPFAELDAIQAELSGDPDAVPAFRSRTNRPQSRSPQPERGPDQPTPPPLAPFPPTSDEADAMPAPPQQGRKTPGAGKTATAAPKTRSEPGRKPASPPDAGRRSFHATGAETAPPPPPDRAQPQTAAPEGTPTGDPATKDSIPSQPGVAFSTRRGGRSPTTTATPTARSAETGPPRDTPAQASTPSTPPTPAQPTGRGTRKEAVPADRRRADMADALSRPLPGAPAGTSSPKKPEKPAARGALTDAVRGAAGGLRSFGQRRAHGKDDAKPAETSMTELMRGAGSSEARISPDQYDDEPDLLAPGVAASDRAKADDRGPDTATPTSRPPASEIPASEKPTYEKPASDSSAKIGKPEREATPDRAKPLMPSPATTEATPKTKAEPTADPAPATAPGLTPAPDKPRILSRTPASKLGKPEDPVSEAEALTVFGARRSETRRGGRRYLGLVLTLLLLLAMASIAMWSSFFVDDGGPTLFNPGDSAPPSEAPATGSETAPDSTSPADDAADTTTPDAEIPPEGALPAEAEPETITTAPETETGTGAELTPQVLTPEEAEARYAQTQIWQRAPEPLGAPFAPGLEIGAVGGPGSARGTTAAPAGPAATSAPDLPAVPSGHIEHAVPLPPPPADTVFELDENGLVSPSPEGTVSPTGIIVFEGAPAVVPPVRPGTPALPEPTPEDATLDDAALEQAVEQAVEAAAALATDPETTGATPEVPDVRPLPRPDDGQATEPDATSPETADTDGDARLNVAPSIPADTDTAAAVADATALSAVETVAADPASIEAAVDAVATTFVDATDLAVATSLLPTRKPANIDKIVNAAMARAAAAPPPPAAPAITTPAIPTSASVANQATTPNALNLRKINLLGISGPSNARRALVRMENGRYITVKVGDRLDGGRVTSITSDGLTYQKGARNFSLQLLPLG